MASGPYRAPVRRHCPPATPGGRARRGRVTSAWPGRVGSTSSARWRSSRPTAAGAPSAGRQQRALLALLVLHRDRPVPPARLVAGLWGESPPRGAEVTLRSHVSHLRRLLADLVWTNGSRQDPTGTAWRCHRPRSTPSASRSSSAPGRRPSGWATRRAPRGTCATRCGSGGARPYPDLDEVDGVAAEVARLEALRLTALEAAADADLATGRHREAVGELEALVAAHPFHERFSAQLVVALYRSGRQADALEVYAGTRERLAEELGLDPGPELHEPTARCCARTRPCSGTTPDRSSGSERSGRGRAHATMPRTSGWMPSSRR